MARSKGKAKEKLATDAELFVVDEEGDETLRRQLRSSTWDNPAAAQPRKGSGKPLKSAEILAQRSRVPARTSKAAPGVMVQQKKALEKRLKITPELKRRLKGMVKHANTQDRGLWDITDPRGVKDRQLSEAVAGSGKYDVWTSQANQAGQESGLLAESPDLVKPKVVKPPRTLHKHELLTPETAPKPIALPHSGQSYNPTFEDHQSLLAAEHAKAVREEEAEKQATRSKDKIIRGEARARTAYEAGFEDEVGSGEEDAEDERDDEDVPNRKAKQSRRKTEKERKRRQENKLLDSRTKANSLLTKAQRRTLSSLPALTRQLESSSSISLTQLHKRKVQLARQLAQNGLADHRSGPARVPKPKQAFLLSEELPESLRQLKTDGNLWSDWLDSSRRRGKVQMERRAFGRMTKKKGRGLKEIEKVGWRKFEA